MCKRRGSRKKAKQKLTVVERGVVVECCAVLRGENVRGEQQSCGWWKRKEEKEQMQRVEGQFMSRSKRVVSAQRGELRQAVVWQW
jgi:hypothetical protein